MESPIISKESTNYFQQLTSVEIENQIWFIAEEVANVLTLEDPKALWSSLDPKNALQQSFIEMKGCKMSI